MAEVGGLAGRSLWGAMGFGLAFSFADETDRAGVGLSRFGAPVGGGAVATKPITPRFAESLRLLAASQLQTQAARSVALDASEASA